MKRYTYNMLIYRLYMDENEIDMKPIERMADSLRRGNIWIWILKLLNEEDKYAYQLRKEINDKFGFDPATVTAYAVLYRLEKSEFVEEASNEFFPNRKYYKITKKGIGALKLAKNMLEETISEIYDDLEI